MSVQLLKKVRLGTVVEVEWEDSMTQSGWALREEAITAGVQTVGYLVARSDDAVLLAGTLALDGESNNAMAIPIGCITDARKLS